jgi:cation diffusion facilitator CzcD-associated flavoprotein CzcO
MTDTSNPSVPEPVFDPAELHRRYLAERDKRLRPDGLSQYVAATEPQFASLAEDPYAAPGFERAPLTDSVDVAVVGGGFTGLLTAGRLRQAGVTDIRMIEKGSDFGGTWYWNRYPGVRCDVDAAIYMPFLEELGYIPSEKYAGGAEILAHCQAVAKHFDLYSNACMQTQVKSLQWDEDLGRWIIRTDRGDEMKARFVCLAGGGFHRPKLPGIPGIQEFLGTTFHTSRWDYPYTGGDSSGNLTELADKRVGIIGTGASAIQCIPHVAEAARECVVFQRTPSSVDIRNNKPTDPAWAATLEPGWQRKRIENFTSIVIGVPQDEDLVNDRWTDVWGKLWRKTPDGEAPPADAAISGQELMQLADYQKMEEIRARIDDVVTDKATAEALKPWYNLFCKRPLYSDEYLQAFNRPSVTLVDTQGRGVERITARGPVFDGVEYELDCIIFATGFTTWDAPWVAGEYQVTGQDGVDLAERWSDGCRSLHGILTHGFPNMFLLGHKYQVALSVNVPHVLGEQAVHTAALIKRCLEQNVRSMGLRTEAEQDWASQIAQVAVDRGKFAEECTPGYFNNEGQPTDGPFAAAHTFGAGPLEYIRRLEKWRSSDDLDKHVVFTYQPS